MHKTLAAAAALITTLPALAHPGHGSTSTDTLLHSLLHLAIEREHVVWIGLAVAAVIGVASWKRWSGR
jgi:hydrogenase/urease accessory protein HupE